MALPKYGHNYRLTRPPELTYSATGVAICKVGLACSEKYKEKETQLFIDATAFNKTAEMLNNVQKGHRVFVAGKLETQQWQDQQSGQNRSKICMIIESFEFIEKKDQSHSQGNNNQQGFQQPQNNGFQQQSPPAQHGGFRQPQNQQTGGFHQPPSDFGSGDQQGYQGPPDDDIPF